MGCWINIGERKPTCPYCQRNLREWMESEGIKVNSKERFGFEDFSNPQDLTLELTRIQASVQARDFLQSNNVSGSGSLTVSGIYQSFIFQYHILDYGEILLVSENPQDVGPSDLREIRDDDSDYDDIPEDYDDSGVEDPSSEDPDSEEIDYPDYPERRSLTGNDPYYARYDLGYAPMSDFDLDLEDHESYENPPTPLFQDLYTISSMDMALPSRRIPLFDPISNPIDEFTMTTGAVPFVPPDIGMVQVGSGGIGVTALVVNPTFSPFLTFTSIVESAERRKPVVNHQPKPKKKRLRRFEGRKPNLKREKLPKNFRRVNQPRSRKQKHNRKRC
jgi:hypothetical protein